MKWECKKTIENKCERFNDSIIIMIIRSPVFHGVRTNGLCSLDTFAEMRVNRWPRHGLKTFQLTRCGHVESLHEVVEDANGNDDEHEHVGGHTDHDECWQYLFPLSGIEYLVYIELMEFRWRKEETGKQLEMWKSSILFEHKIEKAEAWFTMNDPYHQYSKEVCVEEGKKFPFEAKMSKLRKDFNLIPN